MLPVLLIAALLLWRLPSLGRAVRTRVANRLFGAPHHTPPWPSKRLAKNGCCKPQPSVPIRTPAASPPLPDSRVAMPSLRPFAAIDVTETPRSTLRQIAPSVLSPQSTISQPSGHHR